MTLNRARGVLHDLQNEASREEDYAALQYRIDVMLTYALLLLNDVLIEDHRGVEDEVEEAAPPSRRRRAA
jgi:hypothetical protein